MPFLLSRCRARARVGESCRRMLGPVRVVVAPPVRQAHLPPLLIHAGHVDLWASRYARMLDRRFPDAIAARSTTVSVGGGL